MPCIEGDNSLYVVYESQGHFQNFENKRNIPVCAPQTLLFLVFYIPLGCVCSRSHHLKIGTDLLARTPNMSGLYSRIRPCTGAFPTFSRCMDQSLTSCAFWKWFWKLFLKHVVRKSQLSKTVFCLYWLHNLFWYTCMLLGVYRTLPNYRNILMRQYW